MKNKLLRILRVAMMVSFLSIGYPNKLVYTLSPPAPLPLAQQVHYKFDEATSTVANESISGGNNNGTISGAQWTTGVIGSGLSLNGNDNSYVKIPGLLAKPRSITISTWANLNARDMDGAEIISIGDYAGLRMDAVRGGVGVRGFYYAGASAKWLQTSTGKNYEGEGWHHIVYVIDDEVDKQSVYVDGKQLASTTHIESISYTGLGTDTYIGKHGNSKSSGFNNYNFNGSIDDVRIFYRALSGSEIMELFNATRSSPEWAGVKYSPFKLDEPSTVINPVVLANDVTDINNKYPMVQDKYDPAKYVEDPARPKKGATFVADPFLFYENGIWYMFFEVLNANTYYWKVNTNGTKTLTQGQGDLAYATSTDGLNWEYKKIVLDEYFHLSYPYVFKYDGAYYMIPETYQANEIRLYKAESFPEKWVKTATLVSGRKLVDSSIFRYNNKWWMFTTDQETSSNCYLYYSDNLSIGWKEYPGKVIQNNKSIARPGGRAFVFKNNGQEQVVRIVQEYDVMNNIYGWRIIGFNSVISGSTYSESLIDADSSTSGMDTILKESGSGWNSYGMHQFDPWWTGNHWLCAADGRIGTGYNLFSIGMYIAPHPSSPQSAIDKPAGNLVINKGEWVEFSGTGTDKDGNYPLKYLWKFGSGAGIPDSAAEDPGTVTFNTPGTYQVTFTATDAKGIYDPTPAVRTITVKSTLPEITQAQYKWSLTYVDSQELSGLGKDGITRYHPASYAFDGNTDTIWHTEYFAKKPNAPHEIQIDLGAVYAIDTFIYVPRQEILKDGSVAKNGRIKKYEFYVSVDGVNWGSPVATGNFADDRTEKEVGFKVKKGRFIRLRALSEVNSLPFTSVAEIKVKGI